MNTTVSSVPIPSIFRPANMRPGFRPLLVPPITHCHTVVADSRRTVLCLVVTLVVILLVITIFGMSAWNVYEHRFGENTFFYSSGDEVALSQTASDFSATFCDSYTVSTLFNYHCR